MESWEEVWTEINATSQLADVPPERAMSDIAKEAARGANIMDESFSTLRRELLRHELDSEKYRAPLTPRLDELHHQFRKIKRGSRDRAMKVVAYVNFFQNVIQPMFTPPDQYTVRQRKQVLNGHIAEADKITQEFAEVEAEFTKFRNDFREFTDGFKTWGSGTEQEVLNAMAILRTQIERDARTRRADQVIGVGTAVLLILAVYRRWGMPEVPQAIASLGFFGGPLHGLIVSRPSPDNLYSPQEMQATLHSQNNLVECIKALRTTLTGIGDQQAATFAEGNALVIGFCIQLQVEAISIKNDLDHAVNYTANIPRLLPHSLRAPVESYKVMAEYLKQYALALGSVA